jgi:hypothetical protein
MKSSSKLIAAFCAACFVTVAAFAGDPSGTWKWTQQGRQGGAGFEVTLKLEAKDGALSGTILGMQGPQGAIPDVAIGDASFKEDGTLAFSVTREFNGNKRTSKYTGKMEGDTITGSIERQGREGDMIKTDWSATRAK